MGLVLLCALTASVALASPQPFFTSRHYDLSFILDLDREEFTASALLLMESNSQVDQTAKDFVFNSLDLTPRGAVIYYPNGRMVAVSPGNIKIDRQKELMTIPGPEMLHTTSVYRINITYSGRYDKTAGLFKTTSNGMTWIGTRLYPAFSRRLFPCLDEPGNNATHRLRLVVSYSQDKPPQIVTGFQLVENMDRKGILTRVYDSGIPIPVWGLFFTIGDYVRTTSNVWIPRSMSPKDLSYLAEVAVNGKIPLVKELYAQAGLTLTVVLVPGLPVQAESGLAIAAVSEWLGREYGVRSTLWRRAQDRSLLAAIVQSVYGAAMTPANWSDIWLAESASQYLASIALKQLARWSDWEEEKSDLANIALGGSATEPSAPVIPRFNNYTDVLLYLQGTALYKGAAILAMIEGIVPEKSQQKSFLAYVKDRRGRLTSSGDFLDMYDDYVETNASWPSGQSVRSLVMPWLTQRGYPAITVHRRDQAVFAAQKVFGEHTVQQGWAVPIQFEINSNTSNQAGDLVWLIPNPNSELKLVSNLEPEMLVTVNIKGTGVYRTLYGEKDLNLILDILSSNIEAIPPNVREIIIRDCFAFAKTGELKYSLLLNTMRYLEQERTPGALAAMTQGLQELWSLVYHASELKTQFENYATELIRGAYLDMGLGLSDFNIRNGVIRSTVTKALCDYNDEKCRLDTKQAFGKYITPGLSSQIIAVDMLPVIYCNWLRDQRTPQVVTEFLVSNYSRALPDDMKQSVFSYLACPQDNSTLSSLLSNILTRSQVDILPQDMVMAFDEITSRPEHLNLAFDFLIHNYATLRTRLTETDKAQMITLLGQKGSTDSHLQSMQALNWGNSTVVETAVNNAISSIKSRIAFVSKNYNEIKLGLFGFIPSPDTPTDPTPSSPSPPTPPSPTPPSPNTTPASATSTTSTLILAAVSFAGLLALH